MEEYYTYAYLREDGTPYYIGRGKHHKLSKYKRMNERYGHYINLPEKSRRIILKDNLTLEEANKHETYLIAIIGKKSDGTGILRNIISGGSGGSYKGRKLSEETRKKMRESLKKRWESGKFTGNTGMKLNRDGVNKQKKSMIGRKWWNNGQIRVFQIKCPGEGWKLGMKL
jgi:hypothetical protein